MSGTYTQMLNTIFLNTLFLITRHYTQQSVITDNILYSVRNNVSLWIIHSMWMQQSSWAPLCGDHCLHFVKYPLHQKNFSITSYLF